MKMTEPLPENVWFFPDALADLTRLDRLRQILVLRALRKIARAPERFGKELEHLAGLNLTGFRSTYVDRKSVRIVWKVTEAGEVQVVVVAAVAEREGLLAYRMAAQRREAMDAWVRQQVRRAASET